jgi:hypothetical protein
MPMIGRDIPNKIQTIPPRKSTQRRRQHLPRHDVRQRHSRVSHLAEPAGARTLSYRAPNSLQLRTVSSSTGDVADAWSAIQIGRRPAARAPATSSASVSPTNHASAAATPRRANASAKMPTAGFRNPTSALVTTNWKYRARPCRFSSFSRILPENAALLMAARTTPSRATTLNTVAVPG